MRPVKVLLAARHEQTQHPPAVGKQQHFCPVRLSDDAGGLSNRLQDLQQRAFERPEGIVRGATWELESNRAGQPRASAQHTQKLSPTLPGESAPGRVPSLHRFLQEAAISSKVRPLVSGNIFQPNTSANTHTAENSQKAPPTDPSFFCE